MSAHEAEGWIGARQERRAGRKHLARIAIVAEAAGGNGGFAAQASFTGGEVSSEAGVSVGGTGGNGGSAGKVSVSTENGTEIRTGDFGSHGVLAQSVAGKGKGKSFTSGDITITIDVDADLRATGAGGRAILAQSQSASCCSNNGSIAIEIAEGATGLGGKGRSETIAIFDGRANTITNAGTIINPDGGGYVIRTNGVTGLEIENSGLIQGSIDSARRSAGLNSAGITFENKAGGTVGLGEEVNFGAGSDGVATGKLQNDGTISAISVGDIGEATLTADFAQSSGGTLHVDFDFGGANDLVTVRGGGPVALAGSVMPRFGTSLPSSGNRGSFAVLVSQPGIAANTLTAASTATVDYNLSQGVAPGGGEAVTLGYDVNYAPWLGSKKARARVAAARISPTANHTAFAAYIDDLVRLRKTAIARQEMGGLAPLGPSRGDFAFVDDLVRQAIEMETIAGLIATYDRYASGTILVNADATLLSALRFNDALSACPTLAVVDTTVLTDEKACAFVRLSGIANRRDRDGLQDGL